jgi:hypothetical protein
MELKDDRVQIQAEHLDMVDLATMCGALEQTMGLEAVRRGLPLEDVRDHMLDIHLAAMDALAEQVIRERAESEGVEL